MKIKLFLLVFYFSTVIYAQSNDKILVNYTYDNRNGYGQGSTTYIFDAQLLIIDDTAEFIYDRNSQKIKDSGEQLNVSFWYYINQYNMSAKTFQEQRKLENKVLINAVWQQNYKWEITDVTKTINGYKVIKATTQSIETDPNKDWHYGKAIAWYAPDIKIPAGPARYTGLPGLILELEYENFGGIYKLKSIEYNTKKKLKDISKGHKVDKLDVLYFLSPNKKKIDKLK